jgi:hypothetical protein
VRGAHPDGHETPARLRETEEVGMAIDTLMVFVGAAIERDAASASEGTT